MPKANYCPECGRRMKRIYSKIGSDSAVVACGWKCKTHIWIQGYDPNKGPVLMRYDSVLFSIIKDNWRKK